MMGLVVDIDDTLIDTDERRWAIWCDVLGREIPLEDVARSGARETLEKYALGDSEIWKRYWAVLLCWDKIGNEFLKLDKPVSFAAQVLNEWSKEYKVIYLTCRSENMKDSTLQELNKFGYPIIEADLFMASCEDWENYFASRTSSENIRAQLFLTLSKRNDIVRVVDDYPIYFPVYREFKVPERIGLLRSKRFTPEEYLVQGATTVTTWKQLQKDIILSH